jgi:environmental stress-induced protein Ves
MTLRVIRWAECRVMPWANGGGETVEIAVSPPAASFADFDWRLSSALVASAGPFSLLPGIERTLCVISEGAVDLDLNGRRVRLDRASPPFRFSGDAMVSAELLDGPIRDLNVMSRPGRAEHAVEIVELTEPRSIEAAGLVGLFVASGPAEATGGSSPILIETGDTVLAEDAAFSVAPRQGTDAPARLILIRLSKPLKYPADGVEYASR